MVEVIPELRGLSLGTWEGRRLEDMPGLLDVISGPDCSAPGGESLNDLLARTSPAFRACVSLDEDTIIVAHRMVNAVLLAELLGLPLQAATLIQQDPGCVNLLEVAGGEPYVAMINGRPSDPLRANAWDVSLI